MSTWCPETAVTESKVGRANAATWRKAYPDSPLELHANTRYWYAAPGVRPLSVADSLSVIVTSLQTMPSALRWRMMSAPPELSVHVNWIWVSDDAQANSPVGASGQAAVVTSATLLYCDSADSVNAFTRK